MFITVVNEGLKRVAIISGGIVFKNISRFPWDFTYFVNKKAIKCTIETGMKMGLPFDHRATGVAFFTDAAISEKFYPTRMVDNLNIKAWNVKVKCPNQNLNQIKVYTQKIKRVTLMEIGASFSLKNMLPGDIEYIIAPEKD